MKLPTRTRREPDAEFPETTPFRCRRNGRVSGGRVVMVGENGVPETPEWVLPKRSTPAAFEAAELEIPPNIVLGVE